MRRIRENHFTHHSQSINVKEHVFRAAQSNALRIKITCSLRVPWCIGICAHTNITIFGRPFHESLKTIIQCGFHHLWLTCQNLTIRSINGDDVAFGECATVWGCQAFFGWLKFNIRCPNHTGQSDTPPDHSRVAGHTSAFRQHTRSRVHAADILWAGFTTHQNTRLTTRCICLGR